jgi:mono/diheme cytochrome c family protein
MATKKSLALAALVGALLLLLLGCDRGPKSSAGFRLPNGDPKRGEAVFVQMKCFTCHKVDGVTTLPAPTASPAVPVDLGGRVPYAKTDGELVTSIINPSHKIAPALRSEQVMSGDQSRMPDYGDLMTVRQMIDLVAFLQSRYVVIRPGAPG